MVALRIVEFNNFNLSKVDFSCLENCLLSKFVFKSSGNIHTILLPMAAPNLTILNLAPGYSEGSKQYSDRAIFSVLKQIGLGDEHSSELSASAPHSLKELSLVFRNLVLDKERKSLTFPEMKSLEKLTLLVTGKLDKECLVHLLSSAPKLHTLNFQEFSISDDMVNALFSIHPNLELIHHGKARVTVKRGDLLNNSKVSASKNSSKTE